MQFKQQDPTKIQTSDFTNTKITGNLNAFMDFVMISYKNNQLESLKVSINNVDGSITSIYYDHTTDYKYFCDSLKIQFSNNDINKGIGLKCKTKDKTNVNVYLENTLPLNVSYSLNKHERCIIL